MQTSIETSMQSYLLSVTPKEARDWCWPPEILPHSSDRHPFANYSDSAIGEYFRFLDCFPEAYGRLGRFVRMQLGVAQPCPVEYVFREAHIDISDADQQLANSMLAIGFEPDHFLSLNPPEYTKCFTARFELPRGRQSRSRAVANYLRKAIDKAERMVAERPGLFAYSEIECYTHKNKRSYGFLPVEDAGLEAFPFRANEFRAVDDYPKKWDVHVKVPTAAKGADFGRAESPAMLKLRQLFLQAGFYEISSLSGNLIYTVQMVDGRQAKRTFQLLAAWSKNFGGVTAIELEACTRFWRTEANLPGQRFMAPIPKVVGSMTL
jgi:hypothetical protein